MTLDELVGWLKKNNLFFYHFTDTRNVPSIQQNGLLSMRELRRRGMVVPAPGGNDWSFDADIRSGMDRYVHLCFRKQHPMEYLAKRDGRIEVSRFLKIVPEVLLLPGAMVCDGVANKVGVEPGEPVATFHKLDLEVLYMRTDWRDPAVQERLKAASKYEVILPDAVPVGYVKYLNG